MLATLPLLSLEWELMGKLILNRDYKFVFQQKLGVYK